MKKWQKENVRDFKLVADDTKIMAENMNKLKTWRRQFPSVSVSHRSPYSGTQISIP